MKPILPLLALFAFADCVAAPDPATSTQERLVQPGPAAAPGYWDALDNVPGARTGESDYYYSHGGGGGGRR